MSSVTWASISVDLGVYHSTYAGESDNDQELIFNDPGLVLRVAYKNAYIWGSYEDPKLFILGQKMESVEMWGYGIGGRHQWGKFEAFVEFGIFDPKEDPSVPIRNEVVTRMLINHHGDHDLFRHTDFRLGQGYGARIGGMYRLTTHLHLYAGYRVFKGDQDIDGWTWLDRSGNTRVPELGECPQHVCTWWQERGQHNYNAFEIGVILRY